MHQIIWQVDVYTYIKAGLLYWITDYAEPSNGINISVKQIQQWSRKALGRGHNCTLILISWMCVQHLPCSQLLLNLVKQS